MGKTLVIKDADFSANRLKNRTVIDVTNYKTSGYGYVLYNSATVGSPLSPTAASYYDAFFIPINTANLETNNYIVPSYKSGGSGLLTVAIIDANGNLWKKLAGISSNTVPEVTITEETLSSYVGDTFTIFVSQNKSTYTGFNSIIEQEL